MPTVNVQDQLSEKLQSHAYYFVTLSALYIQLSKLRRVSSGDIFLSSDRNDLVDTIVLFLHGLIQLGANVSVPVLRKVGPLVELSIDDQNDAVDAIKLIADAITYLGVPMGPPKLRKVQALDIKSSEDYNRLVDALWMIYYIARDHLDPTFESPPTFPYAILYDYMMVRYHSVNVFADMLSDSFYLLGTEVSDELSDLFEYVELTIVEFTVTDELSDILGCAWLGFNVSDTVSEMFAIPKFTVTDTISGIFSIPRFTVSDSVSDLLAVSL